MRIIFVGDAILFHWLGGSHTVTSGNGASDPQAGSLFDQPMSSA